ncbi:MAG: VWA domain-containing protein [bacterium]|nr:VWA domain-containing protein [bacterium]
MDYQPSSIVNFKVIENISGAYNDPGSLSFSFSLKDDQGRNLFFFSEKNFTFSIGSRDVKNFMFQNTYDHYRIYVPRLPYQKKDGTYPLTIRVLRENRTILEMTRKDLVTYQTPSLNLILVVDTSSSMYLNDQPNFRQRAIRHIIQYAQASGVIRKFSLVRFSSEAQTLIPLTGIENLYLLEKALALIDANGETNIGDGLDKALEELKKAGKECRTIVILLTDGENTAPYFKNHLKFRDFQTSVYTVGLKQNVNNVFLNEIAESTGGEYFKIPDSFKIQNVYSEIINREVNRKVFFSSELVLRPGQATNITFSPDRSMKKMNLFAFWEEGDVVIKMVPEKKQFNLSKFSRFQFFDLRDLEENIYVFRFLNSHNRNNKVSFQGFINSALAVTSFLPKKMFSREEPVEMSVLAFQDDLPITGAKITALINRGKERLVMDLYDDGLHNDGRKNDGLYKNYFFHHEPGEYSVVFRVRGKNLYAETFSRELYKNFMVLDKKGRNIKITPSRITFNPAGAGMDYYQSFHCVSSLPDQAPVKVFSLGLFSSGRTNSPAHISIKPDHFILEPEREKLFNVWIRMTNKSPDNDYTSSLILMADNEFFAIPIETHFKKYHIPSDEEMIKH